MPLTSLIEYLLALSAFKGFSLSGIYFLSLSSVLLF